MVKWISYFDNGQKQYQEYWLDGKKHREDGPAFESWNRIGYKKYECYYLDGKKHREDGPAIIKWKKGIIQYTEYWLNNDDYSYEEWKEKLGKEEKYNLHKFIKIIDFDVIKEKQRIRQLKWSTFMD